MEEAKLSPLTRIGRWCLLGFVLAIPWISINLFVRMPNRTWVIFAGDFVALGIAWLAIGALQRRAQAESQAPDQPPPSDRFSN
jgi:hypothetical protein